MAIGGVDRVNQIHEIVIGHGGGRPFRARFADLCTIGQPEGLR